jgi:hypothetical protein
MRITGLLGVVSGLSAAVLVALLVAGTVMAPPIGLGAILFCLWVRWVVVHEARKRNARTTRTKASHQAAQRAAEKEYLSRPSSLD